MILQRRLRALIVANTAVRRRGACGKATTRRDVGLPECVDVPVKSCMIYALKRPCGNNIYCVTAPKPIMAAALRRAETALLSLIFSRGAWGGDSGPRSDSTLGLRLPGWPNCAERREASLRKNKHGETSREMSRHRSASRRCKLSPLSLRYKSYTARFQVSWLWRSQRILNGF